MYNMLEDSSHKRFNLVWLDSVLICQHWIKQSINVPAQSCNHVKGERNMACDNDLAHLLQQWQPGASICLWFLRRMLMPSVYCGVMARRNVGSPTNKGMLMSLLVTGGCAVWNVQSLLKQFRNQRQRRRDALYVCWFWLIKREQDRKTLTVKSLLSKTRASYVPGVNMVRWNLQYVSAICLFF